MHYLAEARLVALSKTLKTREEQLEKKRAASDRLKEESVSTMSAKAAQAEESPRLCLINRFIMPNVNEIDFGDGFDFDDL